MPNELDMAILACKMLLFWVLRPARNGSAPPRSLLIDAGLGGGLPGIMENFWGVMAGRLLESAGLDGSNTSRKIQASR